MKTIYETEIGIEKKIIILTTKTVEFLLSKNPDSLSLYMFYIKNAKIQKTNSIFNVESFGMKGLGWGRDRYRSAKRVLVEEKFIEDLVRRSEEGKILGHYLKINYLFSEDTISDTLSRISHPVGEATSGKEETNALSNTTINALTNKKEIEPPKKVEEKPFIFKEEFDKLKDSSWKPNKIIYLYWKRKNWAFENRKQFKSALNRELKPAQALEGYNSTQLTEAFEYCEDKYSDVKWTLETCLKVMPVIINK